MWAVGRALPVLLLVVDSIMFDRRDIYDGSGLLTGSYFVSRLILITYTGTCILDEHWS